MGALIFAYCFAGLCVVLPWFFARSVDRRAAEADEHQLAEIRQVAESPWHAYVLGSWSLVNGVGALFLLARGHDRGWAWLGVAVLFAVGVLTFRWCAERLLNVLGDRGHVERSDRYRRRRATSYRFALIGLTGYIGRGVVRHAFTDEYQPAAEWLTIVCTALLLIGAVGFLAVRTRMYLAGDDLSPKTR